MSILSLEGLLSRALKPKFDPAPIGKLVVVCLDNHSPDFADELADAILAAIPISASKMILDLSDRLGKRLALGYVALAFPDRRAAADSPEYVQKGSRLVAFLTAELTRRQAFGHLGVAQSFKQGLCAYESIVFVVRDLADHDALVDRRGGIRGCLVERLVASGAAGPTPAAFLVANALRGTPRRDRALLMERLHRTIPVALANPYQPHLDDDDVALGQDLLLESIRSASPADLLSLLARLRAGDVLEDGDLVMPQFLKPLVENRGFLDATSRVPTRIGQALNAI